MKKEFEGIEGFEGGDLLPGKREGGYSEDFIARVKAEFPGRDRLHKALDVGSEFVGHYLEDLRIPPMKPEDIIKAFESGRQEDVLEAAKKADKIEKLYTEWRDSRPE